MRILFQKEMENKIVFFCFFLNLPGQAYLGKTPLKDAGLHEVKPMRRTPFHEVEHSATRK